MHFSTRHQFRRARKALGVTQDVLAPVAGVGISVACRYETGSARPTQRTLAKLHAALRDLQMVRKAHAPVPVDLSLRSLRWLRREIRRLRSERKA
jgi:predicted transcriptional regulator